MGKTTRLIGVVAIAMALMIAFSGVASASWLAEFTPENKMGYDKMEIGEQGFDFWKSSSSGNLLDNPTLAFGKWEVNFDIYSGTGYTPRLGSLPINPASSKKMNAYSRLVATDVQATTITKVGMTDNPVFNYKIDAEGSNEGSMATGGISAGMSVYVAGDSRLSYVERSSARGSFQFHKVMSYTSKITMP